VNASVYEVKGMWNLVDEIYRAKSFSVSKPMADFHGQFYVSATWKDRPE
jgi:hypothetical protein